MTATLTRPPAGPRAAPWHAPDFASVNWFGTVYRFTANQRKAVAVLWEAWANGADAVDQKTLLEASGSFAIRLRDVFAHGTHPAWRTMIVPLRVPRGCYALQAPAE